MLRRIEGFRSKALVRTASGRHGRAKVKSLRTYRPERARLYASGLRSEQVERVFVDGEEAERFIDRSYNHGRKDRRILTKEVRRIPITGKIDFEKGISLQKLLSLKIEIRSRKVAEQYTAEQLHKLINYDDPVNYTVRQFVTEMAARREKTPAYISFFVTGITPGKSQGDYKGAPVVDRRLTVVQTSRFYRGGYTTSISTNGEEKTSLIERAIRAGMHNIKDQMLNSFSTSPGPFWDIIRVAVEMGFDYAPGKRDRTYATYKRNKLIKERRLERMLQPKQPRVLAPPELQRKNEARERREAIVERKRQRLIKRGEKLDIAFQRTRQRTKQAAQKVRRLERKLRGFKSR